MDGTRDALPGLTKRALVQLLALTVERWDGIEPLGRDRERLVSEILELLHRTALFSNERHWLAMAEQWKTEARRKPGPGLREQWLEVMQDWASYEADQDPYFDDVPARFRKRSLLP